MGLPGEQQFPAKGNGCAAEDGQAGFPIPQGGLIWGQVSKIYGLRDTVSCNSYMTPGLFGYSLAQPATLPPAQHMRGTSKMGSFNLSFSEIIFHK